MTAAVDTAVVDESRLAELLGVPCTSLPAAVAQDLGGGLGYEVLGGAEREAALLRALRASEDRGLRAAGPQRAADWEQGWAENLRLFEAGGDPHSALVPKYNHHTVLRLRGDYVRVADAGFEYRVYTAIRRVLFARWFAECRRVVEFGCGTGTSLLLLQAMRPELELVGTDWAASSQQILARLGRAGGGRITGRRFDMFSPDAGLELGAGTGVLTSAAMEQIGADHASFVDYLLAGNPSVAVHIEPLLELYDEDSLFDEVARRYHTARNYLRGFVPTLRQLARQGRIELLELRRTGFGSFFHEGYGIAVWRPVAGGGRR